MYCIVVYDSDGYVELRDTDVYYKKEVAEQALIDGGFQKSLIDDYWWKNYTEIQYQAYIEELPERESFDLDQPVVVKGRWKHIERTNLWECTNCGATISKEDTLIQNYRYCYYCGANMMTKDGRANIEEE